MRWTAVQSGLAAGSDGKGTATDVSEADTEPAENILVIKPYTENTVPQAVHGRQERVPQDMQWRLLSPVTEAVPFAAQDVDSA